MEAPPTQSKQKGGPLVMVIEDEHAVLQLIRKTLSQFEKLTVHYYSDPASALELAQSADQVDLLISDVMLGAMTGFQLAERVRAKHGAVKIILMSGYPSDAWAASTLPPNSVFLPKPFAPAELLAAVKQQLK